MLFKRFFGKTIEDPQHGDWDPEDQARYIAYLMQWYAVKRSTYLANLIVSNLETYKDRSTESDNEATVMKCERLIRQWQYLARNPQHATTLGA